MKSKARSVKTFDQLLAKVQKLNEKGAIHIKRGTKLGQISCTMEALHLVEEAVEYAAEVDVAHNLLCTQPVIDEAADVLLLLLQVIIRLNGEGCPLSYVIATASNKLDTVFTLNPKKVTAVSSSGTRKSRRSL